MVLTSICALASSEAVIADGVVLSLLSVLHPAELCFGLGLGQQVFSRMSGPRRGLGLSWEVLSVVTVRLRGDLQTCVTCSCGGFCAIVD